MTDILIGVVFVVMILASTITASTRWSNFVIAGSESLSVTCGISGMSSDES